MFPGALTVNDVLKSCNSPHSVDCCSKRVRSDVATALGAWKTTGPESTVSYS